MCWTIRRVTSCRRCANDKLAIFAFLVSRRASLGLEAADIDAARLSSTEDALLLPSPPAASLLLFFFAADTILMSLYTRLYKS